MRAIEALWRLLRMCRQGNLSNYPVLERLTPSFVRTFTNASLRTFTRSVESIGGWGWRAAFRDVERYVMFVGHGRSGHSLIGSLLDAHENVIVAHELDALGSVGEGISRRQLFFELLARSRWFRRRGAKWSGYRYAVPSQHKGEFTTLQVIGDKKGGQSTVQLRCDPGLLRRLWRVVGVPVHILHVKRHPLDNISTLARKDFEGDIDAAIDRYFRDCATVQAVKQRVIGEDWIRWLDVVQEDFLRETKASLRELCQFAGVRATDDYLDDCAEVVFDHPSRSRDKVSYSEDQLDRIRAEKASFPSLEIYSVV